LARITYVSLDYDESLPIFGAVLIIHLDNTQVICLTLEQKASDPAFEVLRGGQPLAAVKTDGENIYWPGGPCLTFDEIIEMIKTDGGDSHE
jgi:hypothetical protein